MSDYKRILVTAALPYANGPVHIGHMAGVYVPADIYVRYQRAQKRDIKFVCGSDEHGVPITIRAMKEGVTPQQIVDKYHAIIKDSFEQMGISFDIYSRTSNKMHHETAAAFFKKLYDDGLFEEKETEQYYDEKTKTFLADRYIIGTCPVCGNPNAYGDQCEKCGSSLSPEQLINPRSALCDAVPVKKKTKHWYFPLQDYEPWLKEWLIEGHKEWKNNIILADKMNQLCIFFTPVISPFIRQFFCRRYITDWCIKPYIQYFSFSIRQRNFYSPTTVSCHCP